MEHLFVFLPATVLITIILYIGFNADTSAAWTFIEQLKRENSDE